MTQLGEGSQLGKELKEDEETEKEALDIRISFFFDGTLNNRINIEAREKNLDSYHENSNKKDDSYANGRTNIAIMEEQVLTPSKENESYIIKIYTEGPGTDNLAGDDRTGYGMGGGDTGVKSKVQSGIASAINALQDLGLKAEKFYIKKLTLDVFGFSRGAAGARYCVHQLLKDKKHPFIKRVTRLGFDVKEKGVEVKYAGLYDTVASYWLGQILHTDNWRLELRSIALAKNVVHLVAAEEHRKNFPLHNIKSAKDAGVGKEIFLPGVHSDVGGSYNTACREKYEKEPDQNKKRVMLMGSDNMIINIDTPKNIEADRLYLIKQGWYRPEEISAEINERQSFRSKLRVNRENINSAYSNIPLKIMADFARKEGEIKIHSKLEDDADNLLRNESDLLTLESRLKSYAANAGNSSTYADWLKDDPLLFEIRHDYLHFSAKIKLGLHPRIKRGQRQRYTFDG